MNSIAKILIRTLLKVSPQLKPLLKDVPTKESGDSDKQIGCYRVNPQLNEVIHDSYMDDEVFTVFEKFRQELNCSPSQAIELLIRRHLMPDSIKLNIIEKMDSMIKEKEQ